jgi:dihydroorotase
MSELLLPGFVDLNTFLGEPGFEQSETVASGLLSAVRGGYVLVAPDPFTEPHIDNDAQVSQLLFRAQGQPCAVVAVAAATRGEQLSELGLIKAAGARAVSLGKRLPKNTLLLRSVLEYGAQTGLTILVHPCDPWISEVGVVHQGPIAERMGLAGIPAIVEEIALGVLLPLVRATGARVHLMGLSSELGLRMLRQARDQGLPVTADVSFRHLLANESAILGYDVNARLYPPLRAETDRKALWAGLMEGSIDAITSGHRGISAEEKEREFDKSPAGAIGLETCFAALWSARGSLVPSFTLEDAARWLCHGPRQVLGLGAAPDPSIEGSVWSEESWTVGNLASRSHNCPELGQVLGLRLKALVRQGDRVPVP